MRGDIRSRQVTSRSDQVMSILVRSGQVSSGQFRLGNVMTRLSEVCQVRVDQVRLGQDMSGQIR